MSPGPPRRSASGIAGALALAASLSAAPAALAQGYTFTTIDYPGASSTSLTGINAAGQIVGGHVTDDRIGGFLYDHGVFTPLAVPGATGMAARGIDGAGRIVGYFSDPAHAGRSRGFVYEAGRYTPLDYPGALGTSAAGINDAGHIVGTFSNPVDGYVRGFLYADGAFTRIHPFDARSSDAYGINADGRIVGIYARIAGISGGIVGHGFLYSNGAYHTIDVPGEPSNRLYGINDVGQIVGGLGHAGFLYDLVAGTFTPIVVPGNAAGTQPLGINAAGQIVGFYYEDGRQRGFLATPAVVIPEPGTLGLVATGAAALAATALRRRGPRVSRRLRAPRAG